VDDQEGGWESDGIYIQILTSWTGRRLIVKERKHWTKETYNLNWNKKGIKDGGDGAFGLIGEGFNVGNDQDEEQFRDERDSLMLID